MGAPGDVDDLSPVANATVLTFDRDPDSDLDALASGTVEAANLLALGCLVDKPHRIRRMAVGGVTLDRPIADDHPAVVYHRWQHDTEGEMERRLGVHLDSRHDPGFGMSSKCSIWLTLQPDFVRFTAAG